MFNYYKYTKKQLIDRIKITKVKDIFNNRESKYIYKNKHLIYFLKYKLVILLIFQNFFLKFLEIHNIPFDCQKIIYEYL